MTAGRTNNNQKSVDWNTPPKYVKAINEFFGGHISLDPCSNKYSLVDADMKYCLPLLNGLKESWNFHHIFVNPPYGRDYKNKTSIYDWLEKCCKSNILYGSEVIALIPVATNTKHWKEFIFGKALAICFLYDTRLKFMLNGVLDTKGAPMACAMVYWGNDYDKFKLVFKSYGAVVKVS